jgi:hypothetical protein
MGEGLQRIRFLVMIQKLSKRKFVILKKHFFNILSQALIKNDLNILMIKNQTTNLTPNHSILAITCVLNLLMKNMIPFYISIIQDLSISLKKI